jgi:hypothetical protein
MLIDTLCNLILRIKSKNRKLKKMNLNFTDFNFKRTFCTIKLSLPRRFGNTQLAIELLHKFPKAIILTANEYNVKEIKDRLKDTNLKNRVFRWSNTHTIETINQKKYKPSIVIVDCACVLNNNDIYNLDSTMFVLLG